jgi:hypothetical protein
MSLCHLPDLIEIVKSVPGPVLDTFYQPPLIKLGPPDSTMSFWHFSWFTDVKPISSEIVFSSRGVCIGLNLFSALK